MKFDYSNYSKLTKQLNNIDKKRAKILYNITKELNSNYNNIRDF